MGVVCVYPYPVPEEKSGQQVVDTIQKQLELLGAHKSGNFFVDCESYQSNLQTATQQRLLHLFHNSEQPATCFSVLDNGMCLVSDLLFEVLILKLAEKKSGKDSYYQQRKGFKVESKGQRYELGDFIIKVGSVIVASNFRGILIEVEYSPCVIPSECWNLMKEFIQSFMGNIAENPPAHIKSKMDTVYTPEDTIQQYLEHFNNFRKATSASVPATPNR
ncbi:hypothetical protein CHS0354_029623 [Potamilus streckersoni]|uniref:Mediator of RNA polymerase II transcription subunit 20 n=1 Tax=Potamilus streckersoni TaxID=2493646 RepID=A0AAE0RTQ4_9BIVA|nr:hypothetical protein CHS0354_029623 [Potamilus streckersoni]